MRRVALYDSPEKLRKELQHLNWNWNGQQEMMLGQSIVLDRQQMNAYLHGAVVTTETIKCDNNAASTAVCGASSTAVCDASSTAVCGAASNASSKKHHNSSRNDKESMRTSKQHPGGRSSALKNKRLPLSLRTPAECNSRTTDAVVLANRHKRHKKEEEKENSGAAIKALEISDTNRSGYVGVTVSKHVKVTKQFPDGIQWGAKVYISGKERYISPDGALLPPERQMEGRRYGKAVDAAAARNLYLQGAVGGGGTEI